MMTLDIVKMDIKTVAYNPLCYGPVEYHIVWECGACRKENILIKKGSLLNNEKAVCDDCGTLNMYAYVEELDQKYEKYFSKCMSIDKSILEKITEENQPEILHLGHNFLFGVFAYLASTLRDNDV